ncbi:MAG: serine protease [Rhodospirillales bacterium]|nr:serine protease [Rhodospirillales bacterium]
MDWIIPPEAQPSPEEWGFDLDDVLSAVVGIRALVPEDAFTASVLGTERAGSGVVIREDGLVLTIGYLITEAEQIWVGLADGRALPGHALAYDQETGFGLVQVLGRVGLRPLPLGDSAALEIGDSVIAASAGGRGHALEARVVGKREFAGYWEYLLEEAIFTAPAHPFWGGAALIGSEGELLGVGSLRVEATAEGEDEQIPVNMFVPIDLLPPILDDLLSYGRRKRPPRPWLGLYAAEQEGSVLVAGLASGGPADQAGVRLGDRVVGVAGTPIADLATLWRRVWSSGEAGATVSLDLVRNGSTVSASIRSADRASFLKRPQLQ